MWIHISYFHVNLLQQTCAGCLNISPSKSYTRLSSTFNWLRPSDSYCVDKLGQYWNEYESDKCLYLHESCDIVDLALVTYLSINHTSLVAWDKLSYHPKRHTHILNIYVTCYNCYRKPLSVYDGHFNGLYCLSKMPYWCRQRKEIYRFYARNAGPLLNKGLDFDPECFHVKKTSENHFTLLGLLTWYPLPFTRYYTTLKSWVSVDAICNWHGFSYLTKLLNLSFLSMWLPNSAMSVLLERTRNRVMIRGPDCTQQVHL